MRQHLGCMNEEGTLRVSEFVLAHSSVSNRERYFLAFNFTRTVAVTGLWNVTMLAH